MKQYLVMVLILAVFAVGGFMLPSELMKWQDQQRLENSETQSGEEVVLVPQTDMTLIEKMQLIQKDTVTTLPMEQGKIYDGDSVIPKMQKELQKLSGLGLPDLEEQECFYEIEDILFLVDTRDGTKSMILWNASVVADDFRIGISMDDETGKILHLYYYEKRGDVSLSAYGDKSLAIENAIGDVSPVDLEDAAKEWGEYLGISLAETYDTPNPTADIYKDREKEIKALMKEGFSEEEATHKVYEAWGLEEKNENWLYAVYEDESGIISYMLRKNVGSLIFAVSFYE